MGRGRAPYLAGMSKNRRLGFSGERLRQLREAAGLSRAALYRRLVVAGCECCSDLLDHWECGRVEPRAGDLCALAVVFGVPMERFFDGVEAAA